MKSNPLISIVIPVYNGEDTILRSVNSALNQTYRNIEVIVVDDKSTDNTLKVLDTIKDTRLKVIKQKENKGGSAARNVGMRNSRGEYITLLDDDDEFLPNRIEKLYSKLSANLFKYNVVTSDFYFLESGKWRIVSKNKSDQTVINLLKMKATVGGCSIMINRQILRTVGYFDESFRRHQDIEYLIRILRNNDIEVVNEPLLRVYGHPGVPDAQKVLDVKKHFLRKFKDDINRLSKKDRNEVYARNWLQVARLFSLDGDLGATVKYLLKSMNYGIVRSDNLPFIPKESYFLLPIYYIKSKVVGKRKWKK